MILESVRSAVWCGGCKGLGARGTGRGIVTGGDGARR